MKILFTALSFLLLGPLATAANAPKEITVTKSPTCGCCTKWEDHLRANGFTVKSISTPANNEIKDKKKIPQEARSCHTGVIGKYYIEGHVPAHVIHKLLKEKPKNTAGIAVPGMPVGSPGMEMGDQKEPYDVVRIDTQGKASVYESIR